MKNNYNEEYLQTTLDNGLAVIIVHKEGYVHSHALIGVNYGSFHKQVYCNGTLNIFPSGIAHFLEHKMFEMEDGSDAMNLFSEMGASVNAFTTNTNTCYFFSTSYSLKEPLELLLDMCQSFHASEESLEKEKDIIVSEIKMYEQDVNVEFGQAIFNALYQNHPICEDIAGTEESVRATSLDDLYRCFALNYHPSLMTLVVITGQDSNEVLDIIKTNQAYKNFPKLDDRRKYYYEEQTEVNIDILKVNNDHAASRLAIAYKLNGNTDKKERYYFKNAIRLLSDIFLSSSNDYVQFLLDEHLINDSFGSECEIGDDYGHFVILSETENIERLENELAKVMDKFMNEEIDPKIFESVKRRNIANNIRIMNHFEDYAFALWQVYLLGLDFYELIDAAKNISIEDLNQVRTKLDLSKKCRIYIDN